MPVDININVHIDYISIYNTLVWVRVRVSVFFPLPYTGFDASDQKTEILMIEEFSASLLGSLGIILTDRLRDQH